MVQVGPRGTKFLGNVQIEVPYVASLKNGHREVVILRCDNASKGKWVQHFQDEPIVGDATPDDEAGSDKMLKDVINNCISSCESQPHNISNSLGTTGSRYGSMSIASSTLYNQNNDTSGVAEVKRKVARIFTAEFPQFYAVITRFKQDVVAVGSEASVINSSSVDNTKISIKAK